MVFRPPFCTCNAILGRDKVYRGNRHNVLREAMHLRFMVSFFFFGEGEGGGVVYMYCVHPLMSSIRMYVYLGMFLSFFHARSLEDDCYLRHYKHECIIISAVVVVVVVVVVQAAAVVVMVAVVAVAVAAAVLLSSSSSMLLDRATNIQLRGREGKQKK